MADQLKFEEFEEAADLLTACPGASTVSITNLSTGTASVSPSRDVHLNLSDEEDKHQGTSELLGGQKQASGFWTFEYYQSFFNVDTVQVLDKIKGSLVPCTGSFVKHYIRSNPDLYGPFWICVTLVFSVAFSGNFSSFVSQLGDPQYHYRPQFHRVTIAAVAVFLYAWLVPLGLWGFMTWQQSATHRQTIAYSFMETLCVYGYSLFIYIPTSILWIIPFGWLQWFLILIALLVSGSMLVITFWPVFQEDSKIKAFCIMTTIVFLHALLAIGCKLYFFQMAVKVSPTTSPLAPTTLNSTVNKL